MQCDKTFFQKNILIITSLLFATNTIHAFIAEKYVYAACFAFLTLTSLVHHFYYTIYTNLIDKLAIGFVVCYGGYIMWEKRNSSKTLLGFGVITFLLCVLFYIYGYFTKTFCFTDCEDTCTMWHSLLHASGSFGHHAILLL